MNEHPCQQLYREYVDAMKEWTDASNVLQSFASIKPLQPGQDAPIIDFESYQEASNREKKAHKEYLDKMEAYMDCAKLHGPTPN